MNFKNAAQRSVVIVTIILLSILIGYVSHIIGNKIDIAGHPREYTEYVEKYSAEYGVPEYIVYAIILTESDFTSNKVSEDGEIGLMQLSPETFRWLTSLTKEELESGILYDPETNIKYGTYMLSYLYTQHNRWKTVLAVYDAGADAVAEWMEDEKCIDENGNLVTIPDSHTAKYVETVEKELDIYRELYYLD
ncbi:MAG: lytic transglycosylase domain-containing protein [Ruminococcaceae bacterium]|nr:lytic transglycosylase domain-containing protein [Oscillospiraceae bacterium]